MTFLSHKSSVHFIFQFCAQLFADLINAGEEGYCHWQEW